MINIRFNERFRINPKIAVINIVLVVNALVWYLYVLNFLKVSIQDSVNSSALLGFVDMSVNHRRFSITTMKGLSITRLLF